jgi:hypothetical protein
MFGRAGRRLCGIVHERAPAAHGSGVVLVRDRFDDCLRSGIARKLSPLSRKATTRSQRRDGQSDARAVGARHEPARCTRRRRGAVLEWVQSVAMSMEDQRVVSG